MTPPTVAAPLEAGSGPSLRPNGASCALARASTIPQPTASTSPPSSGRAQEKRRRTSTRIPSPWDCPLRLVPAARKVIVRPWEAA